MKNWKKVMAMLCAAAMVTGSSAPVWAEADAAEDTEAADDEITELTMDMLDEAAYEGTWLSFEPGVSRPVAQRSNVDLPEPEGPIILRTSPLSTSREMSRRTSRAPKLFFMCFISNNFI